MNKLIVLLIFLSAHLSAAHSFLDPNAQPIHEAYVQPVKDLSPQEILARPPPSAKQETPPKQPDTQAVWISGYWFWQPVKTDFVWVCGVWRHPPPDHVWLSGKWSPADGGWTWVRGAWIENKNKTLSELVYSKTPPLALQNEDAGNAPGEEFFWCSGYWELDKSTDTFKWLSGSWQPFSHQWIFVAAQWIWRPEGYLFVPSYWDWKLENRGFIYDCPVSAVLTPQTVAQRLLSSYPDYTAECCYYHHFQPLFWQDCNCVPVWWGWSDWWSLPWADSWWLWWWYSHEGYLYPPFMVDALASISAPPSSLIDDFKQFPQPLFITPFGVPTLQIWIDAMNAVLGGRHAGDPLIPTDKISLIIEALKDKMPKSGNDRPKGNFASHVKKPFSSKLTPAVGKAPMPPIPVIAAPAAPVPIPPIVVPSVAPVYLPEPAYQPQLHYEPEYTPEPLEFQDQPNLIPNDYYFQGGHVHDDDWHHHDHDVWNGGGGRGGHGGHESHEGGHGSSGSRGYLRK